MTTFILSLINVAFFHPFFHLILKTPGLKIFKMLSIIFESSKLMEIMQNVQISIYSINQNCLNFSNFRQYFRHKKGRPLFEKPIRRTASFLYFLCHPLNQKSKSFDSHVYWDTLLICQNNLLHFLDSQWNIMN